MNTAAQNSAACESLLAGKKVSWATTIQGGSFVIWIWCSRTDLRVASKERLDREPEAFERF